MVTVFFFSSFNRCARRASAGSDKEVSLLTARCCCYYDHCIRVCLSKTRLTAWIHSCVLYTRRCLCVAVAGGCVAVLAPQLCASDPVRRCVFSPFSCTTLTAGIRCHPVSQMPGDRPINEFDTFPVTSLLSRPVLISMFPRAGCVQFHRYGGVYSRGAGWIHERALSIDLLRKGLQSWLYFNH